jgi:outer membrane protein assembly factor BamA
MNKTLLAVLIIFPVFLIAQKPQSKRPDKKGKKVHLAFIPIISYNRSFGMQFGGMGNAYFNVNKKDTVSPASAVGLFGSVFTNKTYFVSLFNRLYFNNDQWRTKIGIGFGNINFQTFYETPEGIPGTNIPDDEGEFIDYRTQMAFFYAEGTRLVTGRLYLGLRFVYSGVKTQFDSDLLPDETLRLFGFGLVTEYDSRNSVFTPHSGINTKIKTFSFLEALGSTVTYHRINIDFNKYFSLGNNATLLARFYGAVSLGDSIPFNGKNVVGRDDLRGYTNGKHRANQVYDIQSEYRWNFYKKWGMVAFAGVALATDNFKGDSYSGLLPSAGAGIRFKAIPSRNINIGIDAAIGKEDWGIYFRIGEAFTR